MTVLNRAGRAVRPAAFGVGALAVGGALFVLARGPVPPPAGRGPIATVNPRAEPSRETVRGSVRHVVAADPPELLIPDTSFPDGPVRLLWLGGRAASPLVDGRTAVTDGAGGVLVFDAALRLRRAALQPGHREIVAVAGDINGGLWLTDAAGAVLRASPDGAIREVGVEAFDYPVVASDPTQPGAWLARLHRQWEYRLPTGTAPLLVGLDENGAPVRRVGRAVVPKAVLLSELASAGHVAVLGDRVYFAPFIRDQLIAFSSSGDTLWLAERGLPQSTAEPDFEVKDGSPAIDYHPVNIGLAVGPDRRLYLLSTPGFTTEEARLDVYHPASGDLLRTTPLGSALPTLAAGDDGRVYLLDEFRLLAGIAPDERDAFPPLSGDLLGGGTVSSAVLEGRVTLVNFWASWCDPCRTEMPALDSLSKSIADARWQFLTVNEDVHAADARAFVDEFRFTFPVVLGRGRLRSRYHYVGLPFTVLVDGQGRVVQRWIGFAGPEQIQGIRAVVTAELGRMGEGAGDAVHAH